MLTKCSTWMKRVPQQRFKQQSVIYFSKKHYTPSSISSSFSTTMQATKEIEFLQKPSLLDHRNLTTTPPPPPPPSKNDWAMRMKNSSRCPEKGYSMKGISQWAPMAAEAIQIEAKLFAKKSVKINQNLNLTEEKKAAILNTIGLKHALSAWNNVEASYDTTFWKPLHSKAVGFAVPATETMPAQYYAVYLMDKESLLTKGIYKYGQDPMVSVWTFEKCIFFKNSFWRIYIHCASLY